MLISYFSKRNVVDISMLFWSSAFLCLVQRAGLEPVVRLLKDLDALWNE